MADCKTSAGTHPDRKGKGEKEDLNRNRGKKRKKKMENSGRDRKVKERTGWAGDKGFEATRLDNFNDCGMPAHHGLKVKRN